MCNRPGYSKRDKQNQISFRNSRAALAEVVAHVKATIPAQNKENVAPNVARNSAQHVSVAGSSTAGPVPSLLDLPIRVAGASNAAPVPNDSISYCPAPKLAHGLALLLGDSHFRRFFSYLQNGRYIHDCLTVCGGRNTAELLDELRRFPLPGNCPDVFLCIGSNDLNKSFRRFSHAQPWLSVLKPQFKNLLRVIFENLFVKHIHIFSLIVSPTVMDKEGKREYLPRFRAFNNFLRDLPSSKEFKTHVSFIDISYLFLNNDREEYIYKMFPHDPTTKIPTDIHLGPSGNQRLHNVIQELYGHRKEPKRDASRSRSNSSAPSEKRSRH
jgi:lysophospholipase L1-like esterase